MAVIKMTQDFINNSLICPEDKTRVEFCDSVVPGMLYEVRASTPGKATIWVSYKSNGKTAYAKVGKSTEMDLAEARAKAKEIKAGIELGADPRGEEKARLAVINFDDFFDKHYTPFAKPRKRSFPRDQELNRLRIKPRYGHVRLNAITRQSILSFQADLLEEGLAPATVNHHIKLIRRMLNLAVDWEMIERNVASKIPMLPEMNQKERYLSEDELSRLVEVLRTDSCRTVGLIVLFLLSTGARVNEALSARWENVDKERRIWRIPATNSKSKRMRTVPLNDSAMDVINQLDIEGKFEHVFTNRKTKKPYVNIAKVWDKLRKKAGLPEMRLHDARHFFCGTLASSGRTLYEIQVIAGHSDPKTTMRYSAISSKALQSAANTASNLINRAMLQGADSESPLAG